ncbi:MAG: hypothetical protein M3Z25_08745 [Actinomycetota bacterium]|nr:hypothetical protein [Actinomycetota bacterium]
MNLRWTRARAEHIGTRSTRYPDATDIEVEWADEAAADRRAVITDPDPKSSTGAMRVVGYSPSAGFVLTVIVLEVDGEYWGVTAWKTTGAERRGYQEGMR